MGGKSPDAMEDHRMKKNNPEGHHPLGGEYPPRHSPSHPSHAAQHPRNPAKHSSANIPHKGHKNKISRGLVIIGILALFIWIAYYNRSALQAIVQQHPLLWAAYQHITAQVEGRTLLGLFYAALFGSLFFITLPIEVIFLYYTTLTHDLFALVLISLTGILLGMSINYCIGRLLGERFLRFVLGDYFQKLKNINDRFGTLFVFFGNLIPSPIEPFSVLLGGTKYSLRKFLVYTFLGKLMKLILLVIGKDYFLSTVVPWLSTWL